MTPLLPLLLLGALSGHADAQDPAPPTQPAPQAAPAAKPAAPRPRPAAPATATGTLTVNITDGGGLPLQGVDVRASGALDREGVSLATGFVRFLNLRGGDYRLRFAHPKFVLLERDVTMRPGVSQTVDVMLSPAPEVEAPAEKPAPAPPTSSTAPPGVPNSVAIPDFIERNFIGGRDPMKEDPLGCTASAKTTMVQVNNAMPERALADADEAILVVYGEGTVRLGNKDVSVSSKALSLVVVPRGTVRGITRKGRNPLIFVSVLSGPPCTR